MAMEEFLLEERDELIDSVNAEIAEIYWIDSVEDILRYRAISEEMTDLVQGSYDVLNDLQKAAWKVENAQITLSSVMPNSFDEPEYENVIEDIDDRMYAVKLLMRASIDSRLAALNEERWGE